MGVLFILLVMLFIHVARAANILIISNLFVNIWRIKNKVSCKFQFVMWHSGLRGAIAFALAIQSTNDFPKSEGQNGEVILTLTLIYTLLTILLVATTINPLIQKLSLTATTNPPPTSNKSWELENLKTLQQQSLVKKWKHCLSQ